MPPVSLPPSPPPHQPSPPWTSLASRRIHPPPWSSSPPLDRFQSDRALVPDPSVADAYYNFPSPPPHQLHAGYGPQYLPLEGTNALGLASGYTPFLSTDDIAGDIDPLASGSEVPSPLTSLPPTVPPLDPCPLPPHATQMTRTTHTLILTPYLATRSRPTPLPQFRSRSRSTPRLTTCPELCPLLHSIRP